MNQKEELIYIINAYIERLETIKLNIDNEIKEKYFNLSCLGGDLEGCSVRLFRKYYKRQKDDDD